MKFEESEFLRLAKKPRVLDDNFDFGAREPKLSEIMADNFRSGVHGNVNENEEENEFLNYSSEDYLGEDPATKNLEAGLAEKSKLDAKDLRDRGHRGNDPKF